MADKLDITINYLSLLENGHKPISKKVKERLNNVIENSNIRQNQEHASYKHKEVPKNVKNLMPSLADEEDRWKAIYKDAYDNNDEHTMQATSLFLNFIPLLKYVVDKPMLSGWLSSLLSQLHLATISPDKGSHKENVKRITDRL